MVQGESRSLHQNSMGHVERAELFNLFCCCSNPALYM